MEVLYHIRPYFMGMFPYIGLIYGRYLQFRILKIPLRICYNPIAEIGKWIYLQHVEMHLVPFLDAVWFGYLGYLHPRSGFAKDVAHLLAGRSRTFPDLW
jgi:hypothetical protein